MSNPIDQNLQEQLQKLQQKYAAMGQDLSSYLDGLLYSDYLTYWDYIHLDTLLSLQTPKTHFKDEKVFIVYHQITELYFNLALWEIEQIVEHENLTEKFFCERLDRIISYFRHLVGSFGVMVDGMDRDQFLKFRMSLLPASGFQSGQYRMIEICSTDLIHLVNTDDREKMKGTTEVSDLLEKLYWRSGATELATGKKTLTLKQFEEKYIDDFKKLSEKHRDKNLRQIYLKQFAGSLEVVRRLREFDELANVRWPLSHMKSAAKYLQKDPEDIKATGGTNWQKYLPPRFQRIFFYPELWNEQEKKEWGKAGLMG
ncbi:MAG TPA: tryptophan 2,3-dioxygenase family protein [Cyclobacteriaceae bacterium]|jgi:tryptophan 2,3-dioxygenase|nr:tryptophan 2,3-dioxygenase family protein [Cyclobacteriaceae bacterium]